MFGGFPTQEPASVVCDDEQRDLLYPAGLHRNLRLAAPKARKKVDRETKIDETEWTWKVKVGREKFLEVGEASTAIF